MLPRGKYSCIDDKIQQLIVEAFDGGEPKNEVVKKFKVKLSTLCSIYSSYNEWGSSKKLKSGHRQPKPSDVHKNKICDWQDQDVTLTLDELKEKFRNEYSFEVSHSTIRKALKHFLYSLKRTLQVPEWRDVDPKKSTIIKLISFVIGWTKIARIILILWNSTCFIQFKVQPLKTDFTK